MADESKGNRHNRQKVVGKRMYYEIDGDDLMKRNTGVKTYGKGNS